MSTIYFDSELGDDDRRRQLYAGHLFVFSPRTSTRALCEFAAQLSHEAFAPLDPVDAQHHLPVEKYVEILAELKPRFIHHPRSKELIRAVLEDFGCELAKTYFDVPRLRTATSDNYLTSGIAYAFHPHRDTWYSAPFTQINWWMPVYELASTSTIAFHPRYWSQAIENSSSCYNYQRWNQEGRKQAVSQVGKDTRVQPRAEERLDTDSELRVVCQPGGAILFSGAQLHATCPNDTGKTRFSVDFRTVHLDDTELGSGAPNIDSECTGTPLRDYLRGTDLARLPEELIARYGEGDWEEQRVAAGRRDRLRET